MALMMMMRLDVGVVMLFYMMFTCGSFTVMKNNDKFVSAYTRIATTVSLSEETQQQNRRFLDRVLDARDTHSMITFLPEETEGKPVPLVVALHGFFPAAGNTRSCHAQARPVRHKHKKGDVRYAERTIHGVGRRSA